MMVHQSQDAATTATAERNVSFTMQQQQQQQQLFVHPVMNYPLRGIPQPHAHDVLCGRGGQSNTHPGNTQWRMLVSANKELYVTLPKRQKMLLSQSVVNAVRSQNPPGRFLQKDAKTDLWYDVGDKRAQEKTSQALREGAPEIRLKLKVKGPEKNAKGTDKSTESSDELSTNDEEEGSTEKVDSEAADSKPFAQVLSQTASSPAPSSSKEPGRTENKAVPYPLLAPSSDSSPIGMPSPMPPTMMAPPILPPPIPPQGPVSNRGKSKKWQPQQQQQQQQQQQLQQYGGSENGVRSSFKDRPFVEQHRQVHFPEDQMHPQFQYTPPSLQQQQQQQQSYFDNSGCRDALPPPPSGMEARAGCSFGSLGMMSVGEQDRLMLEKFDDEPIPLHAASGANRFNNGIAESVNQQNDCDIPRPVDGGLEPIGFSFGSMMSIGTDVGMNAGKLEGAGLSFGSWSAMSYSVMGGSRHAVAPPDGGLQDIGTSFGSLTLAEGERERIIALAERDMMLGKSSSDDEADAPPTFLQQQKSTGNLLDCSDTESEDEDTSADASAQKSAQWEKLQAALAEQDQSIRNSQLTAAMPPSAIGFRINNRQQHPYPAVGSTFQIPRTGLDRDFSQMSAISVQEDFEPALVRTQSYVLPTPSAVQQVVYDSQMPPPPAAIKKGRSDDWSTGNLDDEDDDAKLEYTFLNRGNSLASEQF